MAPVVYVDLNLEFDLGRTTYMQLEVWRSGVRTRTPKTANGALVVRSNEKVIIAFAFAAPPP